MHGDFYTPGDLGHLDADGWLYMSDRRTDLIISGGVNIYPAEIESVLLQHPAVGDAVVIGVPDEDWGSASSPWSSPPRAPSRTATWPPNCSRSASRGWRN